MAPAVDVEPGSEESEQQEHLEQSGPDEGTEADDPTVEVGNTFEAMASLTDLFLAGTKQLIDVAEEQAANEGAGAPHATGPVADLKASTATLRAALEEQKAAFDRLRGEGRMIPLEEVRQHILAAHESNVAAADILADDARKLGVAALKGNAPAIADEWLSAADTLWQVRDVAVDVPFAQDRGLLAEQWDEFKQSLGKKDIPAAVIALGNAAVTAAHYVFRVISAATKAVAGGVLGILSGLVGFVIGVLGWRSAKKKKALLKELGVKLPDKEWKVWAERAYVRSKDERDAAIKEMVLGLGGLAVGIATVVLAGLGPAGLILAGVMVAAGLLYLGVKKVIGILRANARIKAFVTAAIQGWVNTVSGPDDDGDAESRGLLEAHDEKRFADAVEEGRSNYAKAVEKGKDADIQASLQKALTSSAWFSDTYFDVAVASTKELMKMQRMATARQLLASFLGDKPSVRAHLEVFFTAIGLKPDQLEALVKEGKAQKAVDRVATKLEAQE